MSQRLFTMKKLPFLLIVLLQFLWSENAKAQIVKCIGIRTGWASTFPEVEELQNGRSVNNKMYNRNMVYSELQVELFSFRHLSLLTNFSYISKGFEYWDRRGGMWFSYSGRFAAPIDYFSISAAPKFSWKINNFNLYGFAGPYICIRTNYAEYYIDALWFMPVDQEPRFLKSQTWGGTFGTGVEYNGKSKRFSHSIQLQYMQDFTLAANFTQNPVDYYGTLIDYKFKAKFQTLLLSYGLHYSFNKKVE